MDNNFNYEDCKYYRVEETDYDVTNGHSSYTSFCIKNGKVPLYLPESQCKRCVQKNKNLKECDN